MAKRQTNPVIISILIGGFLLSGPKPLAFAGQSYLHRFSKGDMHEFTPKDQPNLAKFSDMLTVNNYKNVRDGEALASIANAVLENYKKAGGAVVGTNSIPRTANREAEHFIAVVFERPTFSEAAFARFRIQSRVGASLVYSHRVYGKTSGATMRKWLAANGPAREKSLMALSTWPTK